MKVIKTSYSKKYTMVEENGIYHFISGNIENENYITTPGGVKLSTDKFKIANIILRDLDVYGEYYMQSESILPWQYTWNQNFELMSKADIVRILHECFGYSESYLEEYTSKQLLAICCISNAYEDTETAVEMALIVRNYSKSKRKSVLTKKVEDGVIKCFFCAIEDVLRDFEIFELYFDEDD